MAGALLQDNQPGAFYSNTLTATEQRYAIIEKECPSICLESGKSTKTNRDGPRTEEAVLPHGDWLDNWHTNPYLTFKDELSLADGIVYKGQQAVIPKSMRPAMLDKIHKTHFEAGSCIRRAKVSLFWPGMTSDIKNKCISCPVFAQYTSQAPKEPMLSHDIPERPWSLISQDILMWEGKWHLVTTCHHSDWIKALASWQLH